MTSAHPTSPELSAPSTLVLGVDVADRHSFVCVLGPTGEAIREDRVATTPEAFSTYFATYAGSRVAIEIGTHAHWMAQVLTTVGCEVLIANARRVALIARSQRKSDRNDAKLIAELARVAPHLLQPVQPREDRIMEARCLLKARDALVRTRTNLVNAARGLVKPFGVRLPSCSSPTFAKKATAAVPEELRAAILPMLEVIAQLTNKIAVLDRDVEHLGKTEYPVTLRLREIAGVGPLTTLAFVLAIGDPHRFRNSRSVGAYFGLTPKMYDSGDSSPQLRITKSGDPLVRRLLVSCAHYILGHFGPPCDLRDYGLALSQRGGRNAKKRAVVAVARKLAVLLHRLWITGESYQPRRNAPLPHHN